LIVCAARLAWITGRGATGVITVDALRASSGHERVRFTALTYELYGAVRTIRNCFALVTGLGVAWVTQLADVLAHDARLKVIGYVVVAGACAFVSRWALHGIITLEVAHAAGAARISPDVTRVAGAVVGAKAALLAVQSENVGRVTNTLRFWASSAAPVHLATR
jgi:hypothetical protein